MSQNTYYGEVPPVYDDENSSFTKHMYFMFIACADLIRSAEIVAQHIRHVDSVIPRGQENFLPRRREHKDLPAVPTLPHPKRARLLIHRLRMLRCKLRIRRSTSNRQHHRRKVHEKSKTQYEINKVQERNDITNVQTRN